MSVSTTTAKVAYTLSSTTQTLSVPFYFLESSHLKVIKTVSGADTVLTIGTNYTVTGAGNNAGGSITLTGTGVAIGNVITIRRDVPITQLVDYVYNDKFPADTHERALDKLTMIAQSLNEQAGRSLRFSEGESVDATLGLEDRKGKFLFFDATTGAIGFNAGDSQAAADAVAAAEAAAASAAIAAGAVAALVTDVANYGVSPGASASTNRAGIQSAFDAVETAGGGEVQFNAAGNYLVNDTMLLPSNITVKCADGVVIKKSGTFGAVFRNKGATTRTFNQNIRLLNLTLDVSAGGSPSDDIYGVMGEVVFYYVKNWLIDRIRCDTVHASQFFIQTCRAEDGVILSPWIYGNKDCLHFSGGTKRVRVIGGRFSGYDDRMALNASDYVECTPEMGDIEDIVYQDCVDLAYTSAYGYASRMLTGSWGNYAGGIATVRRGTTVVNGGYIYRCTNSVGAGPYTTSVAPTHTTLKQEVTGADGIKWMCYQASGITSASVRRITFRKCRFENPGSGSIIYGNWISDTYDQSVTPGSESLSEIDDITFDDCTYSANLDSNGFVSTANLKNVRWVNCDGFEHLATILTNGQPSGNVTLTAPVTTTNVILTGNKISSGFSNSIFDLRRANTTVKVYAAGNSVPDSIFSPYITSVAELQLPVCDIYISLATTSGGKAVTAVQGHLVRTLNAFGGWVMANAAGTWLTLAKELDDVTFKSVTNAVADANDALLAMWRGTSGSYGWKWKLNGASTGDLQLFRTVAGTDTEVVRFARGTGRATFAEYVVVDGATGKTLRIANGVANGTVATTLGSTGPTGSTAGAPSGWMRINVNGADRYIPYW
jgi:hypothetical protein